MTDLPASIHQLRSKLLKVDVKRRPAFKRYCSEVLSLLDKQQITEQRAAILIAGTMFLGGLDDDPQLEEIMHLAGGLEVPEYSTKENWLKLRRLVEAL